MVLPPGEMLLPDDPHRFRPQEPLLADALFIKEVFSPIPQRPPQPICHRDTKAHFGSLRELPWYVPRQDLSHDAFASSVVDPHGQRQAPGKLDNPHIQEGTADLKPHGHARTIHFDQDVVGQAIGKIHVHQRLHRF